MSARSRFEERFEDVEKAILRMGEICGDMIRSSVEAAHTGDAALAETVIAQDDEVDRLNASSLSLAVTILMQEAPVGVTLRRATALLGVIGDLEKVADDTVKLARRAMRVSNEFPGEMRLALVSLGRRVNAILASALRLVLTYTDSSAQEIEALDVQIDAEYALARDKIIEFIQREPEKAGEYLEVMEIFHALEHAADRAVAVAERLRAHHAFAPTAHVAEG